MDTFSNSNNANGDKKKLNKCNLCDYASGHKGNLRTHLKTHFREKAYKCNQCDFASVQADNLRIHSNAINATLNLDRQAILGNI